MSDKSPTVAVVLSFLFTGIGLVYLGKKSKGILLFGLGVLCNLLGMIVIGVFHYLSILIWIIGIFITYKDSKKIERKPAKQFNYSRRVRHYDRDYDGYHDRPYNQDYDRHHDRAYDRHDRSYERHYDRAHDRTYERSYDRIHDRSYDRVHDRPYNQDYDRDYDRGNNRNY